MGKTKRHEPIRNLLHNGDRGPKHSLMREYHQEGTGLLKDWRNLLQRRDYDSDRNKGWRHIINKLCRSRQKQKFRKLLTEELD